MPQRIREAIVTFTGARMVLMGAALLTQVLVSRRLGPESYGLYGTMVGAIAITTVLANSGVSWSLPKIVASFDVERNDQGISAAYRTALGFEAVLLILVTLVLVSLAPVLPWAFFHGEVVPYLALIFGTLFFGFQAVYGSVLLGLREIRYVALLRLVQAASGLILVAALVYGLDLGLEGAAVAYALSLLAATAAAVAAVRFLAADRLLPTRRRLPELRSFGAVVTLNSAYVTVMSMGVPVLVALLITDDQRNLVGYAALLAGLGRSANNLLLSTYRAGYVYMARWLATARAGIAARFVGYALAVTVVLYGGAWLVGAIWGEELLAAVFGDRFRPAAGYIGIAILALALTSVHRLITFASYAAGKQNRVLGANLLGSIVFLTLLLGLGLGTEANPVDVAFLSAAAGSGTSLIVNGLFLYREGLLVGIGATVEPSPTTVLGGTGGTDYEA